MAESGIYEIVNLVNGKRYVGSALNFRQRWHGHRSRLNQGRHHSKYLQASWTKYGEDAFVFRVIEHCGRDVLLEREQHHIDLGCEYNVSRTAGSPLGVKHSDETRARMSESRRGKPKDENHVEVMAEGAKAQWADPAVRSRMSAAIKANWQKRKAEGYRHPPMTAQQRERMSESIKASYTPELRQRRSEANKARWAKWRAARS
jgi:group I intron endonuclease